MSTQFEFEQTAIRLFGSEHGQDHLILLVEGGDGSVIDMDGRVVRSWYVIGYGTRAEVQEQIVHRAALCEAGALRMDAPSSGARGDAYVRRWQQRIVEAWTLQQAFEAGFSFSLQIDLDAERVQAAMATSAGRERLARLIKLSPPIAVDNPVTPGQPSLQRHLFSVSDLNHRAIFNESECLGLGPWARKVRTLRHARRPVAIPVPKPIRGRRVVEVQPGKRHYAQASVPADTSSQELVAAPVKSDDQLEPLRQLHEVSEDGRP